MRIFRRKAKKKEANASRVLTGLALIGEQLQSKWAAWMNKKTAGFSQGNWKIMLLAFVLFAGSLSVYLTVTSLTTVPKKAFRVQTINIPSHTNEPESFPELSKVHEYDHTSFRKFLHYMDSLSRMPNGIKSADSIRRLYSGLLDSVKRIEEQFK